MKVLKIILTKIVRAWGVSGINVKKYAFIFMIGSVLQGQTIGVPKNIQTPNAASLGKFGDVPVSLYTGTPNISIPIYSLNEKGVPLDISLSYDATGVRVNSVPGWVGQNWTLNAGGVITRTIKGQAVDEMNWEGTNTLSYENISKDLGYYYKHSNLNTSDWASTNNLRNLALNSTFGAPDSFQDLEPDVFTFNFMGITGKFFLGHDGQWKVFSESNLKVEINMSDNVQPMGFTYVGSGIPGFKYPKVIGKIKLTDDKGNTYIFGGTQNAIEYTFPDFFNQLKFVVFYTSSNYPYVDSNGSAFAISSNAWYLTEVRDKFNHILYSFSYDRGAYQANFYWDLKDRDWKKESGDWLSPPCQSDNRDTPLMVQGQLIAPSYLKSITTFSGININFTAENMNSLKYKNADIFLRFTDSEYGVCYGGNQTQAEQYRDVFERAFWYSIHSLDGNTLLYNLTGLSTCSEDLDFLLNSLQWKGLKSITISYPNSSSTINVNFSYNNVPAQRLFLKGLNISRENQKYTFEYNNLESLPGYLSKAVDLMGYYRGTDFSNYSTSGQYASHASTRQPNSTYAKYGTLKKIIYPTGGSSEFEYELHDYSKKVSSETATYKSLLSETGQISGLRIKQIIHDDARGNIVIKKYIYKQNLTSTVSSGNLIFSPTFYYPQWRTRTLENGDIYHETVFSINSIIPMSNFMGTHIEYSNVIEKTEGNGYMNYKYYNYADYPDQPYAGTVNIDHSAFDSYTDFSFKRGKLKEQAAYSESNDLLEKRSYTYQSNNALKIRGFDYNIMYICQPHTVVTGNAYEIYYPDNLISQETHEVFLQGIPVTTAKEYAYKADNPFYQTGDIYLGSTKIKYSVANGQENYETSTFTYPFDYPSNSLMTSLSGKRIIPVISSQIQKNTVGTTAMNNISGTKTEYSSFNVNNISLPLPFEEWTNKGDNPLERNLTVDKYDSGTGNILSYHNENGIPVSFIWGYKNQEYPVAKIEGATYEQLMLSASALISSIQSYTLNNPDNQQGLLDMLNQLRANSALQNAMVTTYTYKPLSGVSTITASNGITEYYYYDSQNRLEFIKDKDGKVLKKFEYNFKQ